MLGVLQKSHWLSSAGTALLFCFEEQMAGLGVQEAQTTMPNAEAKGNWVLQERIFVYPGELCLCVQLFTGILGRNDQDAHSWVKFHPSMAPVKHDNKGWYLASQHSSENSF